MKKKRKEDEGLKKGLKKGKRPEKREWIILITVCLLFAGCYLYMDLPKTTAGGLNFLTALKEGNLSLFYIYEYPGVENSALPYGMVGGSYDLLIYAIFAIYNLPLWIWEQITGYSFVQFIITKEYAKGIVWVFSALASYFIYKIAICCDVKKDNAIWAPFLFLSSGIFFASEVTICGYDIISTAFSLLGIYGYIKKNNKCFFGAFAVAIATKLFAFWLFIPLLLIREKNVWKLIYKTLISLSAIIIPKIYVAIGSKYELQIRHKWSQVGQFTQNINNITQRALNNITQQVSSDVTSSNTVQQVSCNTTQLALRNTTEPTAVAVNDIIAHSDIIDVALFPKGEAAQNTFLSLENFPLLFAGMFSIWICCYLIKRELNAIEVVYLSLLVMSIFVSTIRMHPYWGILLVPYVSLILVINAKQIKTNLLLEILMSIGYVINRAIMYPWCFGMGNIERMVGPGYVFGYDPNEVSIENYGLERIIDRLSLKIGIQEISIAQTFGVLFVVSTVMFLYNNRPKKIECSEEYIGETEGVRSMLRWRFIFSVFVAILPIIGLLLYVSPYYWGE